VSAPRQLVEGVAVLTGAGVAALAALGYREEKCFCMRPDCAGIVAVLPSIHVVRGVLEPIRAGHAAAAPPPSLGSG
jgi:hypothetical protein